MSSPHARQQLALLLAFALSSSPALAKGTARLLSTDAAEPIERAVIGLQRTAVPLGAGFALDTSLLADLALAPNVGLRWGVELGPHRLVLGARYTHFVGTGIYSSFINSQAPIVKRYEPEFSGPSFYGVYGLELGSLLLQAEGRVTLFALPYASITGAAVLSLSDSFALVAEAGTRLVGGPALRAAGGIRFTGEHFGFTLGAAYVGITDPLLPVDEVPVLPAIDLSYTF